MKHPLAFVIPLGVLAFFAAHFQNRAPEAAEAMPKADRSGSSPSARVAPRAGGGFDESEESWRPLPAARAGRDRLAAAPNGDAWVSPAEAAKLKAGAEWHQAQHHKRVDPEFAALSLDEQIASLPPALRNRAERYRRDLNTLESKKRQYLCWAPGTDPEIVETFRNIEREGGLAPGEMQLMARQFLDPGHWDRTAIDGPGNNEQGLPVTLTWSIMPDGSNGPEFEDGSRLPTDLRDWLADLYGVSPSPLAKDQPWFPIFQAAFDAIAEQTGLTFVYQPNDDGADMSEENSGDDNRGDIRIGAHEVDGNGGILGFAFAPDFGDIIFDSTDGFFDQKTDDSLRLFNVLSHEIGHAIGLAHVCPINETKLMEPFVTTDFRGYQYDDVHSLQRQYGDFLEPRLPDFRDNDSPDQASVLDPPRGEIMVTSDLSIDGAEDVDFYRVSLEAEERLSIRVNPANPLPAQTTYLEGAQADDGSCSDGVPFNPTNLQNLEVALIDSDGETVINNADGNPAGQREDLFNFVVPADGDYFVRVQGSVENEAQLYDLQLFASSSPTASGVDIDQIRVVDESNRPANFSADPGETVSFGLTLTNNGALPISNLTASPEPIDGLTDFSDPEQRIDLLPGESGEWIVTVAQDTACRDLIDYTLNLAGEGGFSETATFPVQFADLVAGGSLDEGFEQKGGLPAGWESQIVGKVNGWASSTQRPDAGARSAHVAATEKVGLSMLMSPVREIGPEGGTLSFRHWYDLEEKFDGAVLEYSLDGGLWEDIMVDPDVVVVEGEGYDDIINPNFESPFANRLTWTGRSGQYVSVSIDLPSEWARLPVQFRWVLATDINVARPGWFVDSVVFNTEGLDCLDFRPALSLESESGELVRGEAAQAMLRTPLPLARDFAVELAVSGDFSAGDLASPVEIVLPAGATEVTFPVEIAAGPPPPGGTRRLVLTLLGDADEFAAESPSELSFTLEDPPLDFGVWSAAFPGLSADPRADDDRNGFANLVEYTFDSNPLDPASKPAIVSRFDDERVELRLPPVPDDRTDVKIGAETSTDLVNWVEDGVETTAEGFAVPRTGPRQFLRLKVDLISEPKAESQPE